MKTIIIFLAMAVNFTLFAADVFESNSQLPKELQIRLLKVLQEQASCIQFNTLKEKKTLIREEEIDEGNVDYFFTTAMTAIYYSDLYHPARLKLTIASAEYDIANPAFDKYELIKFSPSLDSLCEE